MARISNNGTAQSVSPKDFNARVKALVLAQPDTEKGSKHRGPTASPKRPAWK